MANLSSKEYSKDMKKNAFSFIELILVVIIVGILAAYSTQMLNRNVRIEAMNHILSMLRYTQNLALHDSKHDRNNAYWQRSFWRFEVYNCSGSKGLFYKIGTDQTYSKGLKRAETAIDPSNGKFTFWDTRKPCPKNSTDALNAQVSPNIFLTQRYGINRVVFSDCPIQANGRTSNDSSHIGFDNFGRPIKGYTRTTSPDYYGHVVDDCSITFYFQDSKLKPFTIVVKAESGYAYIREYPNL